MTTEYPHLTENHRNTLYHLEQHPTSHNLEWPDSSRCCGKSER